MATSARIVDGLKRTLKAQGIDKNTFVLFTSDNGPAIGSAGPLKGGKGSTLEGGVRVPFIARWPGKIAAGGVDDSSMISAVDLLPTFCRLADVTPPAALELDGTDLSSFLKGGEVSRPKPLLWCYYNAINEHRVAMRRSFLAAR